MKASELSRKSVRCSTPLEEIFSVASTWANVEKAANLSPLRRSRRRIGSKSRILVTVRPKDERNCSSEFSCGALQNGSCKFLIKNSPSGIHESLILAMHLWVMITSSNSVSPHIESAPPSKQCTKTKQCCGTMTWTAQFRALATKDRTLYRPAWLCDTCKKHDYIKGVTLLEGTLGIPKNGGRFSCQHC